MQRYDLGDDYQGATMIPMDEGDWVDYDDAQAAIKSALEDACARVQKELFPLDNPRGQHRYTTHFWEVRDAIMGDA